METDRQRVEAVILLEIRLECRISQWMEDRDVYVPGEVFPVDLALALYSLFRYQLDRR